MKNLFQEFIYKRTYAKFLPDKNRREEWPETVDRYIDYLFEDVPDSVMTYKEECREAILKQEVMGSMRMLLTSGESHRQENISGYNCCFTAPDENPIFFAEIMYILMNGCGVGYSVEKKYTEKLPIVPDELIEVAMVSTIEDSKLGWAEAFHTHLKMLYCGLIIDFDYSKIRPKGSPLKTFGGYASGHEVLKECIDFTTEIFKSAKGRKLKPIEVHSIVCKEASVIVVGGVRRSALISFSDLDDEEMAKAKSGEWYVNNVHFALANNSAVYHKTPTFSDFMKEYQTIYNSYSGERGFYNIEAVNKKVDQVPRRRELNKENYDFYSNPCCEIVLRNGEFCNLSEVIIRPDDTESSLFDKIRIATILGTLQSRYTNFKFLRPKFAQNCIEERLLGISLTGIYDNEITRQPTMEFLQALRNFTVMVNQSISKSLGIEQSASITCIKPSGSVSAMNGCSSGIHPAYAKYYIRNVRVSKSDPLSNVMINNGVPHETDFYSTDNYVFSFPLKSADGAVTTKDITAVEHFRLWKTYNEHFCEHKPSITINYDDSEFLALGQEIYNSFDQMTGIALLPKSNSTYKQMPFMEITKEEYEEAQSKMPKSVDWTLFQKFENTKNFIDNVDTAVCVGVNCEL
jgi:ribonucleoside-triphosphate reductase (thioredoxin)